MKNIYKRIKYSIGKRLNWWLPTFFDLIVYKVKGAIFLQVFFPSIISYITIKQNRHLAKAKLNILTMMKEDLLEGCFTVLTRRA